MTNQAEFGTRIKDYLRQTLKPSSLRYTQADLAAEIGANPSDLSRKLNNQARLSDYEVRAIIKTLAIFEAITTRQQAIELLDLMDCPSFSSADWAASPLDLLKDKPELYHSVVEYTDSRLILTFEQKTKLAARLLACSSLTTGSGRASIIRQLPLSIQHSISLGVTNHARQEMLSIVDACLLFPQGLTTLIEVVRVFDVGTTAFKDLEIYVKTLGITLVNEVLGNYIKTAGVETLSSSKNLSVFLCHCSADKSVVRDLYNKLKKDGFRPWLDEEDLLPGQKWQEEIPKAVSNSDVVLVCLSEKAVTKVGYVQKEITFALDVAGEQPEETIFLIPVKLEECTIPNRLAHLQWVNLFGERGYEKLLKALATKIS